MRLSHYVRLSAIAAIVLLSVAMFSSCDKKHHEPDPKPDPNPDPVVPVPDPDKPDEPKPTPKEDYKLFAVGQDLVPGKDFYTAVVWTDDKRIALSDSKDDAFCNKAVAVGDVLYVAGCAAEGDLYDDGYYEPFKLNVGTVWTYNDTDGKVELKYRYKLDNLAVSNQGIAVVGDDIYSAGFSVTGSGAGNRVALQWKNDQLTRLTDGTNDALVYCVATDGKDVYVGGYEGIGDGKKGYARIWKNGVAQNLTDGTNLAKVTALAIEDGHVYAAGTQKSGDLSWQAVLWIDGKATVLSGNVAAEVKDIAVKDGKWYVMGNYSTTDKKIVPCYWTSEGEKVLVKDYSLCQGLAIALFKGGVYTVGSAYDMDKDFNEFWRPLVWKDGVPQTTYKYESPNNATIWDLEVMTK